MYEGERRHGYAGTGAPWGGTYIELHHGGKGSSDSAGL
jgi:hypothetical protein